MESETVEGDIVKSEVDWDLMDFDEEFLKLQLYFDSPESMSQDLKQDVVSVTFYGTEFFQSEDSSEVEFGTTLTVAILRQVSDDSTEVQASLGVAAVCSWVIAMTILLIPFFLCVGNSLLPVFMFLVTLQLIAHMVLFGTDMPAEVIVYLRYLLDVMRLKFSKGESQTPPDFVWMQAGYESIKLGENITGPLTLCLVITGLLALISVSVDSCIRRKKLRRPDVMRSRWWPSSLTLVTLASFVFGYAFLELFLCSLYNIKVEKSFSLAAVVLGLIFIPFAYLAVHFRKFSKRYGTGLAQAESDNCSESEEDLSEKEMAQAKALA